MATPRQGDRRPGAVGEHRPAHRAGADGEHGGVSHPRALVLVVVAVALGAYLLQLGGRGAASPAAVTAPGASTTTTTSPSTTPTTAVTPTKAVKVLVANASSTNGVAGFYTSKLAADGWGTLTAVSASATRPTSTVYYAPGQKPAAGAIAATLGVASSSVLPLGTTTPVQGVTGASVVVVAGDDLAAQATPTATSTAG